MSKKKEGVAFSPVKAQCSRAWEYQDSQVGSYGLWNRERRRLMRLSGRGDPGKGKINWNVNKEYIKLRKKEKKKVYATTACFFIKPHMNYLVLSLYCVLLTTIYLFVLTGQAVSFATMKCEDSHSVRGNALSKIIISDISGPKLTLGTRFSFSTFPWH